MNITTLITNLKTFLDGLSWGTGQGTSFNAIYTYPNYLHVAGYPFAIIGDSGSTTETLDNRTLGAETEIKITIAGNWASVDAQDDDLKREEVALRIREATDTLKVELMKIDTIGTLGGDWTYQFRYEDIQDEPDYNVLYRDFYLTCKSTIDR